MKPHLPVTLTLLPPPEDRRGDVEIVEEWARGLDWVRWLLGSVRARTEQLSLQGGGWQSFTDGLFREKIAPALEAAWAAAHAGDLDALLLPMPISAPSFPPMKTSAAEMPGASCSNRPTKPAIRVCSATSAITSPPAVLKVILLLFGPPWAIFSTSASPTSSPSTSASNGKSALAMI